MCLIVSTLLVFRQVCWSVVTRGWVSLVVLSNSCQKTQWRTSMTNRWNHEKSIISIDLTQQFSSSVFTDFRYQSIKITWLLPIFIDWLATPGVYLTSLLQEYHPPRSLRLSARSLFPVPTVNSMTYGERAFSSVQIDYLYQKSPSAKGINSCNLIKLSVN